MKPCVEHKEFLYEYRLIVSEFIKEDNKIVKEKEIIKNKRESGIITQEMYSQTIKKLNKLQIQIKNKSSDKLNSLQDKYTEFLKIEFNLEDEEIDERDLMLLSCGLILDKEHMDELNNKYKNNSKMKKILKEYKKEPNIQITINCLNGYLDALKEFIENTKLGIHGKENCYWRLILENEVHLEAQLERMKRKMDSIKSD